MEQNTPIISLPEACAQLGISYTVGWRWLLTGRLKGERRGRRWAVALSSVEAEQAHGSSAAA